MCYHFLRTTYYLLTMRIISVKGTNVNLTESITDTIEKKLLSLGKFTEKIEPVAELSIEVGKTTNHHKKGHVWRAEANLHVPGKVLRAEVTDEGLYAAIDGLREELMRQIKHYKDKRQTQVRAGARKAKKLTSLNPDAMYKADRKVAERLREDDEL
jgi:ribosomal subunit interface protein